MRFVQWTTALVLAVTYLSSAEVSAQDGSWAYIGLPENFSTADQLREPVAVCAQVGWTPQNSGLRTLGGGWDEIVHYAPEDVAATISGSANGELVCTIVVLPNTVLSQRPDVTNIAASLGYSNLSEALIGLDGSDERMQTQVATPSTENDGMAGSTQSSEAPPEQTASGQWPWLYLIRPGEVANTSDLTGIRACVSEGWTPENSGLSEVADTWTLQRVDGQTYRAIVDFAAMGGCDVVVLPIDAASDRDVSRRIERGRIVELSAAIAGTSAPDASAAQISQLGLEVQERLMSTCSSSSIRSSIVDCACLASVARERAEGVDAATFAAYQRDPTRIVNGLASETMGGDFPLECLNEAGISELLVRHAEGLLEMGMFAEGNPSLANAEAFPEFIECVVDEGLEIFRSAPRLGTYQGTGRNPDFRLGASQACMRLRQ
jgi:hypothetical protein